MGKRDFQNVKDLTTQKPVDEEEKMEHNGESGTSTSVLDIQGQVPRGLSGIRREKKWFGMRQDNKGHKCAIHEIAQI